jgi:hypothetical protein
MNRTGRRALSRIAFRMPRTARFASRQVVLVDLSMHGAGIRHTAVIAPLTEGLLEFRLEREQHAVQCLLGRSKLEIVNVGSGNAQIYHSGLRFRALDGAADTIRQAIRRRVERALKRQHANAWADPSAGGGVEESSGSFAIDLLASWMENRLYVRCTLDEKGQWRRERVNDPTQPASGFTVLSEEDPAEIDLLCRTFASASEPQRNLIRLFASIGIQEPSRESRDKFAP